MRGHGVANPLLDSLIFLLRRFDIFPSLLRLGLGFPFYVGSFLEL